jgi:hypothetical protein
MHEQQRSRVLVSFGRANISNEGGQVSAHTQQKEKARCGPFLVGSFVSPYKYYLYFFLAGAFLAGAFLAGAFFFAFAAGLAAFFAGAFFVIVAIETSFSAGCGNP